MTHSRLFFDAIDCPADSGTPSRVGPGFTPLLGCNAVRALLALTLGALTLGCGTFVSSTYVNEPPRPLTPIQPQDVEVFVSGPPQRDYVDVALLEVVQTQSFNRTGTDYMLERLRVAAGNMGCDAVVLTGATEHSAAEDALFDEDTKTLLASCIVYARPERLAESEPDGGAPAVVEADSPGLGPAL